MTSPAPVIQRLKTHQANARRMLTPGLKNPAGQQRSFSPVLDGFGGQKHTLGVQKMRFLNNERLGGLSPEKINLIGRELPARFSNPAGLLHISPPSAPGNSGIWSAVEQVLPAAGATGRQESAPDQPGTLRQGSVIQRIQNTPKPGQDFESFKNQVQSRASKPAAPVRKPPRPDDPSVRRYSRIEEVTARETPPSTEPPADVQRQPEPADEARQARIPDQPAPASEPPPTPLEARTSNQPAPASEPRPPVLEVRTPDQPAPASEPRPQALEVQTHDQPASASERTPSALESRTPDQPAPASEPPPTRLEARTPDRTVPASEPTPPAPKARTPDRLAPDSLPRAMPVPQKASPPLERALPKAKPTSSQPETHRSTARPTGLKTVPAPVSRPTASRPAVVQRQPDQPAAAARPVDMPVSTPADFVAPDFEQQSQPEQTGQQPTPHEEIPAAQPVPRQPESPLQTRLAGRRKAPEQVRFIEPRVLKTEAKTPVSPPVLSLQKSRMMPPAASKPATSRLDLHPASLPSLPRQEAPVSPRPGPAMEMPVARPPERPSSPSQPGGAQVLSAIQQAAAPQPVLQTAKQAEASSQQTQAQPASPAVRSAPGNVVQRLWDEHSPPSSASSSPSSGTSGDSDSSGGQAGVDLDQLAEDVLPIVKRLIEIESERSSGYLR